jgi:hypothetical protein
VYGNWMYVIGTLALRSVKFQGNANSKMDSNTGSLAVLLTPQVLRRDRQYSNRQFSNRLFNYVYKNKYNCINNGIATLETATMGEWEKMKNECQGVAEPEDVQHTGTFVRCEDWGRRPL